ncbi:MAG: class IIb bacteriocin, lactobin A/cerein 7B family [Spirochaetales bacterium]|nr:class IIb bacteriocin, lactobin A/cerein 7B family [Spirochaetales bacterium]
MSNKNENKKDGFIMDKGTELNAEELKDVSGGLLLSCVGGGWPEEAESAMNNDLVYDGPVEVTEDDVPRVDGRPFCPKGLKS